MATGYSLLSENKKGTNGVLSQFLRILQFNRFWLAMLLAIVLFGLAPYLFSHSSSRPSLPPSKNPYHEETLLECDPYTSAACREKLGLNIDEPVSSPVDNYERPTQEYPHKAKDGWHRIEDGILYVDQNLPAERNPIHQLIHSARIEWQAKVDRQSRTLRQAVHEYMRRNGGRKPPKGFDHWWKFVVENEVTLPDEYDQILKDLAPFRGISPPDLRDRIYELSVSPDAFTISVKNGTVSVSRKTYDADKYFGADARVTGQIDFIKDVAKWIPDVDAVFSIHDSPSQFVSGVHLKELLAHADNGTWIAPDKVADRALHEWGGACPMHSPAYAQAVMKAIGKGEFSTEQLPEGALDQEHPSMEDSWHGKSFISDHSAAMNLCQFPKNMDLHGLTAGVKPHLRPKLLPMFSLSKTNLHSDILVIPMEQWHEDVGALPWDYKEQEKLLWRGRNTGGWFSKHTPWRNTHRPRISKMSSYEIPGMVEIIPSPRQVVGKETVKEAIQNVSHAELNKKLIDIGLAYEPIQCVVEDGTCDEIKKEMTYRPVLTFDEENHYKFILDIDGNAWSARFNRVLSSRALILKSTIFNEWWNERIQPWLHYIPVKVDYSDIYDIMTFFRGDGTGANGEDKLAGEIAGNGRQWAAENWRRVDMSAYMFRLYLEWARLTADDPSAMDLEF